MRLNLQQKITLGLLLPAALLMLLFSAAVAWWMHEAGLATQRQAARLSVQQVANAFSQILQAAESGARSAADFAVARPDLPDADYQALLEQQLRHNPAAQAAALALIDATGVQRLIGVERQGDGYHWQESESAASADGAEWLALARARSAAVWTPPLFDARSQSWRVSHAVPALRKQQLVGVSKVDVQLDALGRALAGGVGAEAAQRVLLDAQGRVLFAPERRLVGRPYTDWASADTERAQLIAAALAGDFSPAAVMGWGDGARRLTAAATVAPLGWVLLQGSAAPPSPVARLLLPGALALLLSGLVTLVLLRRLVQRQFQSLRQLAQRVLQLATGATPEVARAQPGDEVQLLSRAIGTLSQQLEGREQRLTHRQRELADRVREQQVLYRVADTLGWVDLSFRQMLDRVTALLPEAWPLPEQVSCRINLAEFQSVSEGFTEGQRGLFAPIDADGVGGGVWVFATDEINAMEAGQQELVEGVAQQLSLAYRRERAQQQLEKLNRELEQRVELRTEALRNAERLLRDITNSMPGAVYQVVQHPPRAAELRFVSAGVEAVYGVPRDRALASYDALMSLVFPEDLSTLNAVVANAIGRRQSYSHVHRITHGETGQVRWIRTAANTMLESDGTVLLNGYWIDVTDQKELELELEAARREADAASEAKSRFLANMSHEIRTPMNAIIGLTHLAAIQTHEPKIHDQLTRVEDSAKALLGLLNDILDFSKIEAGRMTVERIPFDLWNLLDRVQSLTADRAAEKGLQFNVWRVPELPRDLMGDPLRLHQVLLNLVSNAVKFTQQGTVTLNCTVSAAGENRSQLVFEVQDTGVGIDPIQMTRLFSAFTQADNSTTRRFGGTGLGLTISKELVTLMGGQITVDSTPGVGSTFSVKLHFDHADPSWRLDRTPDAESSKSDPLIGARVLLVDDNFINLEVAGELLRQARVDVVTASNGREALERLAESEYDAVLMDLQMPEMDGITATEKLRLDPAYANLPVIAMTANAMAGDRERCLQAGMNDHVPKPIDPQELRQTLARWLRRRATGDLGGTLPPTANPTSAPD